MLDFLCHLLEQGLGDEAVDELQSLVGVSGIV